MRAEQQLADLIFSRSPFDELNRIGGDFERTDRVQVGRFHARLLKRIEGRLSAQFGGCLALLEEKTGRPQKETAADFAFSPEHRSVREDLSEAGADSESRFEIAFLNFILRSHEGSPALIQEFSEIFLAELSL